MIVLDLKNKENWKTSSVNYGSSAKVSKRGYLYSFLEKSGDYEVRILSKNISGNGLFYVKILNEEGKPIFDKKVKFTSKSWNETVFRINLNNFGRKAKLLITRDLDGIGRFEIGRLTVRLLEEKVLKSSSGPKLLSKGKLIKCELAVRAAVIVPYGIYGGAEVYLKNLFLHKPNSLDVDFLFLRQNSLIKHLNDYNCFILKNLNKLKHKLIKENYDKIIYYNSKSVYAFILNLKKEKLIYSDLIEIYHSNFRWSDSLSSLGSRDGVSKIIRISDTLCNNIRGNFRLKTIPVSIDTNKYQEKKTPLSGLEKFNSHKKLFGLVARLSPEKNISYAIELFGNLPDYKLIIIGDGPLRQKLQSKIDLYGLKNIELLGYKENVYEYYNLLDAFILTSKYEGTPISIIEAMSYNIPIFTTDVGEIRACFAGLDSISYLTENLEQDCKSLLNFNFNKEVDSNDFVLKKHNSVINSAIFFDEIIDNSLMYSEKDNSLFTLDGQFI